jgi:CheY-like chemotaxis protein
MRSPLSCILGNLELINYEMKEHKIYELISPLLQTSIASSVMLETLVNDILDADRISKGIFQMDSMRVNLKETIQECIDTMGMAAKARGNKIEFNYEGSSTIISDRVRLKQILLNFLSNSVKFTSKGRIQVSVRDKEDTKRIEIKDNGKGISPENLRNLFQKYHSDRHQTENTNGLGFGLYICKSIISRLGPKDMIDVHSEVGKGTTFSFEIYKNSPSKSNNISKKSTPRDLNDQARVHSDRRADLNPKSSSDEFTIFNLNNQFALNSKRLIQCKMKWGIASLDSEQTPMIKATRDPSQVKNFTNLLESLAPNRASSSNNKSLSKPVSLKKISAGQPLTFLSGNETKQAELKVLIVDDDPFILELLKDFFAIVANQLQIEVLKDSSDSVAGAIEKFRSFDYDLVIVDFNLPDGTGTDIVLSFSNQISENRGCSKQPLFALSTGFGKDDAELESCKNLFFEILTKPISLEKFRSLLRNVMKEKFETSKKSEYNRTTGPDKFL